MEKTVYQGAMIIITIQMKLLLEYRSSPPSKNSWSEPEYELKVKVQNSDNQHSVIKEDFLLDLFICKF